MAKATKEQLARREVIEQWETNEQLQIYLTTFYRSDVNEGELLISLIPELKLVLLSINAVVSRMYMEAFNYDNITARNYAYVAEVLSKSMNSISDRDLFFLEKKDLEAISKGVERNKDSGLPSRTLQCKLKSCKNHNQLLDFKGIQRAYGTADH